MDRLSRRFLLGASTSMVVVGGAKAARRHGVVNSSSTSTFTSITLSNNTFTGGASSGTLVGTITVGITGASFTGTVAVGGTNASDFAITGSAPTYNLVTSGVVASGTYSINLTATQSGVSNSPYSGSSPYTITGTASGSITDTVYNVDSITAAVGTPHTFVMPFAEGELPSGYHLVLSDGNPVQVDNMTSLWGDGSANQAILSYTLGSTIAASGNHSYTISAAAGAPSPGSGVTAAAIAAATNFVATFTGGDCGANTYVVGFNDIVNNFSAYPWGTSYPEGGYDTFRLGNIVSEYGAWRYLKNNSSGNSHAYAKMRLDIACWGTNPAANLYTIDGEFEMPNTYGPIATSGVDGSLGSGNLGGQFYAICEITNGGTVIGYMGGPNDPRAGTAVFTASTNTVVLSGNAANVYGAPVAFSGGTLPSLITANATYGFYSQFNNTGGFYLFTCRGDLNQFEFSPQPSNWAATTSYGAGTYVWNAAHDQLLCSLTSGTSGSTAPAASNAASITDGGSGLTWRPATLAFGTNGSGTIAAFPLFGSCQQCGCAVGDINGNPFWTGSTLAKLQHGHDFTHLTTTKAIHPYNTSWTPNLSYAPSNGAVLTYYWGEPTVGQWESAIDATGDGAGDQRIGAISSNQLVSLYAPSSTAYYQTSLNYALCEVQFGYHARDERGGILLTVNNGPTSSPGSSYTNLPPSNPTFGPNIGEGSPGMGYWAPELQFPTYNGETGQAPADTSHFPSLALVPYLKTGRRVLYEQIKGIAGFFSAFTYQPARVGASGAIPSTYYNCNWWPGTNQTRGMAWFLVKYGTSFWFTATNDPLRQYVTDMYEDFVNGFNIEYPANMNSSATPWGMIYQTYGTSPGEAFAPWQIYMFLTEVSLQQWRGIYAPWATMRAYMDKFTRLWNNFYSGACLWGLTIYNLCPFPNADYPTSNVEGNWANTFSSPINMINESLTYLSYSPTLSSCPAGMLNDESSQKTPPPTWTVPISATDYAVIFQGVVKYKTIFAAAGVVPDNSDAASLLSTYNSAVSFAGGIDYYSNGTLNCPTFAIY